MTTLTPTLLSPTDSRDSHPSAVTAFACRFRSCEGGYCRLHTGDLFVVNRVGFGSGVLTVHANCCSSILVLVQRFTVMGLVLPLSTTVGKCNLCQIFVVLSKS
ncbi:unnamed protein product [Citrullus colocynthis]|uniref:Uncharacterized protein n=1 Tax=Citrullus colocynthis TaxID=252529 RepID=A0ABP0YLT3_9ROSI